MMSNTQASGQVGSEDLPAANHYNVEKFNTIERPMVTGGSPNNPMTLGKFERSVKEKNMNPFKTSDQSPEATKLKNTANMGPGKYSP